MLGNLIRTKQYYFYTFLSFLRKNTLKKRLNKHSFDSENFKQLRGNHNKPFNPKILMQFMKVFNLTDLTRTI